MLLVRPFRWLQVFRWMQAGTNNPLLMVEGWLFFILETGSNSCFLQFAVNLSVSDLSHCRTANAVQVTFVRCYIIAMRCYLVSSSSDGVFISFSDMSVYTSYTWNILSFIPFTSKPCFIGQAALPHIFVPRAWCGLGSGHWRSHWGRGCWVMSLFFSWRSPKLKCLYPVFATVMMGAEGWTRDLQRSFLTLFYFSLGAVSSTEQ